MPCRIDIDVGLFIPALNQQKDGTGPKRLRSIVAVTVRLSARRRVSIDDAATAQGKWHTEFMVEGARQRAIDVLLDQRLFMLDPDQTGVLADGQTNPLQPNTILRDLLSARSPVGVMEFERPCSTSFRPTAG